LTTQNIDKRIYWSGKSPTVRKAAEEYIEQLVNHNEVFYPFKFKKYHMIYEGWVTIKDLSEKYGVSRVAISNRIRSIWHNEEMRKIYFGVA